MVMISHKHQFIFIKTKKTAGTSVEEYFESILIGVPESGFSENTFERVAKDSYVTGRTIYQGAVKGLLLSHASSGQILRALGQERFDSYIKVSCVRNPWDQIVSFFWWRISFYPSAHRIMIRLPMILVRTIFSYWLSRSQKRINSLSYTAQLEIDGVLPKMKIIHFETMKEDIDKICEELGIDNLSLELPNRKTTQRKTSAPYQTYYSRALRDSVAKARALDLANFGYSWSESPAS
jgi:hypothetical protein